MCQALEYATTKSPLYKPDFFVETGAFSVDKYNSHCVLCRFEQWSLLCLYQLSLYRRSNAQVLLFPSLFQFFLSTSSSVIKDRPARDAVQQLTARLLTSPTRSSHPKDPEHGSSPSFRAGRFKNTPSASLNQKIPRRAPRNPIQTSPRRPQELQCMHGTIHR